MWGWKTVGRVVFGSASSLVAHSAQNVPGVFVLIGRAMQPAGNAPAPAQAILAGRYPQSFWLRLWLPRSVVVNAMRINRMSIEPHPNGWWDHLWFGATQQAAEVARTVDGKQEIYFSLEVITWHVPRPTE